MTVTPVAVDGSAVETSAQTAARLRRILLGQNVLLLVGLGLLVLFLTLRLEFFFTTTNLLTIVQFSSVTFIVATGFTLVLIGGGLDLSIGSGMMMTGVVSGKLFVAGVPLVLAFTAGFLVGGLTGLANGLIITKLRINPLVATLAMLFVLQGTGFIITNGRHTQVRDDGFRFARERIFDIPVPVYFLVFTAVVSIVLLRTTKVGRHLFAVGGNPEAARQAAMNVDRFRLGMYVVAGLYTGLAGVVLASLLGSIAPNSGTGREFAVATAVFLGGASLTGGKGSIVGTLIGVLFVTTLANGLIQLAVVPDWVMVIEGILLIVAVAFDQRPKGGFR